MMAEIKSKPKVEEHKPEVTNGDEYDHKEEAEQPLDFAGTIGKCLAPVMRDSANMTLMNASLDKYIANLTPAQKNDPKFKDEHRKQLVLGRQALESVLQRFLMSVG